MIKRFLRKDIENALTTFPVVGLLGSRQVGKTTLAIELKKQFKSTYLDLELHSDLNKLQNAELYLRNLQSDLVIIDEIQRKPDLFPLLRALVDEHRRPGRFLLLGSASPSLIKQSSESLAGRISYFELSPFSISELGNDEQTSMRLWLRGGYPDSYLSKDDHNSFLWRLSFIQTYLERDIPQLGIRIPALQLRRFWTMLAHNHGQLWNASQIANSLGLSAPTIRYYLDILNDSFIVKQLQPYHTNIKKRLVKSPKVYIRDSGLLHALLNLESEESVLSHPIVGSSWEGFVMEQLFTQLPAHTDKYFYRSSAGAEIDLVYWNAEGKLIAVEIKFSLSPKPAKGFWNAFADLKCSGGFIIYPGRESYPISENVWTLPLSEINRLI